MMHVLIEKCTRIRPNFDGEEEESKAEAEGCVRVGRNAKTSAGMDANNNLGQT